MASNALLSLVVPVYYEEDCIDQFILETVGHLKRHGLEYEIIFIDDGSTDTTVKKIRQAIEENSRIRLIELSYNHGKQAAVTAGIEHAQGDWLLYMDPDLQDPPEEIIRFVEKAKEGYDLVFGVRKQQHGSPISVAGSKLFWFTLDRFTGLKLPRPLAVMRIFSRRFADEFLRYRESNRFIEGIFARVGQRQTTLEIEQRSRFAGKSKFSFKRRLQLAFTAIIDFSELPLQVATRFGFFLIGLGISSALLITFLKLFGLDFQLGWPSVFCLLLFGFGCQIFFLGIIGTYVGKIYLETKQRPLYSIKNLNNFPDQLPPGSQTS